MYVRPVTVPFQNGIGTDLTIYIMKHYSTVAMTADGYVVGGSFRHSSDLGVKTAESNN